DSQLPGPASLRKYRVLLLHQSSGHLRAVQGGRRPGSPQSGLNIPQSTSTAAKEPVLRPRALLSFLRKNRAGDELQADGGTCAERITTDYLLFLEAAGFLAGALAAGFSSFTAGAAGASFLAAGFSSFAGAAFLAAGFFSAALGAASTVSA